MSKKSENICKVTVIACVALAWLIIYTGRSGLLFKLCEWLAPIVGEPITHVMLQVSFISILLVITLIFIAGFICWIYVLRK